MAQQIEIKNFIGSMDLDSPNEVIGKPFVKMARNVEWYGMLPNLRAQSVMGTTLIPNILLPGTGVNLTIGRHYDAVNKRLFIFNYNSDGNHGIYIFYTLTQSFVRLIQNGINTDGDVLGFVATGRIHSIDIIYGDGADGDLLFFIDSLQRPRKANINHLLNGVYTPIKSVYLDLIKAPPIPPPQCTYENDATVTNNNMINALFNIACTHIYDDFEQSVLGSGARQPLPSDPFDPQNNTNKTRNARIAIYLPTGDQNVKKIRIWGKQTKDGATTDWFEIDTLIKADLGIGDNTVYRYLFFNNGNYRTIDTTYAVLDADAVPLKANTQSLLNGNTMSLGGCTEGYDFVNPSFSITTANGDSPAYALNGTLFFAAPNGLFTSGQPQITVYLTGVGVNDGFGNPTTLEKPPALSVVRAKSGTTDISFQYLNVPNSTSIPFILSSLQSAATSAGWVVDTTDTNSFTIHYPTGNVILQSSYINGIAGDHSPYKSPICCHFPESAYSYGTLYRDYAGRTNGVISNVTGNIKTQTLGTSGQIPIITLNLNGFTPPIWAATYEVVRTDTLTYNKYLDWVSDSAYQGTGQGASTQYAYFGITNIATYNTTINATEGVVSYGFSPGDRVRVQGRYSASGSFTSLNLDYAVIGVAINPVVNGVVKIGTFVQIYYPTADINADFKFDGTTDFQNYKILLYSYKAYSPANQNFYFQVGQQYGIGNPGTVSAYHMGNTADGQVVISDGDVFNRDRSVPIINSYAINTGSYDQQTTYSTEWTNPGGGAIPIVDNGIWKIVGGLHQNAGLLNTQYPSFVDNDFIILNESASAFSVRLRGTQTVIDKTDPNGQFAKYIKIAAPGNIITVIPLLALQTGLQPGVTNTFTFDTTVSLGAGCKLWIVNYAVNEMLVGAYVLTLDVIRTRTINVFDASFSDIYKLVTNSDNKPNLINVTAKQTYFSTLFRWGQAYQLGTELNNSNRFYPLDFDEFDKSYGAIMYLYVWQRELRIFQERRCGHVGIYAKFIKDNAGNSTLVTTDDIISKNNIEYFEGNFGVGNQPSGIVSSGFQNYFYDPIRGCLLRLSLDGIKNISEEHNVQTFVGNVLPNYLNAYTYAFGGNATLLGAYNFKKDKDGEIIFMLQGGTSGASNLTGQSIAFNERKDAFTAFYDFAGDDIVCCENQLYSFSNGNLYGHNNTTTYANFYGTQKKPSLTVVFNENIAIKKKYLTTGYQSYKNKIWGALVVGDILTSSYNEQTGLQQISQLLPVDFRIQENNCFASFLFDANSRSNAQLALVNGDVLTGQWLQITFTAPDAEFDFLYMPFVRYKVSPKTP